MIDKKLRDRIMKTFKITEKDLLGKSKTAYEIAEMVNNNPFHTVAYPEMYRWIAVETVKGKGK